MSKVRALIGKLGFKSSPNNTNLNHTKKQDNFSKEYRLNSPDNLNSTLDHELDMLFYKFNYLRTQFLKDQSDFSSMSEEDLCFIHSCRISFKPGFFYGYKMDKIIEKGMYVMPPRKFLVYNEDGTINVSRSQRVPAFIQWIDLGGIIRFECPFPLYSILQLAQLNPFFCRMDQAELENILLNLLREKRLL